MRISNIQIGLREKLIIGFFVLALFPMVIMAYLTTYRASGALLTQTESQMGNLTSKSIEQLELFIEINRLHMGYILQALRTPSQYVEMGMELATGIEAASIGVLSKYQETYPYLKRVMLLDRNGSVKLSTGAKGVRETDSVVEEEWFNKTNESKGIYFSDMFLTKKGEPTVIMANAVLDMEGEVGSVIAVEISGKHVTEPVDKITIGDSGFAFAINTDGYVVAHPHQSEILKLNLASESFFNEMKEKRKGLLEYTWEGKRKFASFQECPTLKWMIVSAADKDDILGSVIQMRYMFFILGTIIALVAIGVAAWISWRISKPLIITIERLTEASDQVSSGSEQVSSSSHYLAEGASDQAAAIEEISSSLEEVSSMTKQNADNASQADNLMRDANRVVERANESMSQLTISMQTISDASEETSKIVKTIDEIAFQTNLLALNAAVEAARAGEAGAGFAVVAEEVRNLALKAAEAARNTAILIEETIKKVKDGSNLVTSTNKAFSEVATVSAKVGSLLAEIAEASKEQALSINQLNKAVAEMDGVVQQNAANSEQSSSSSEEMKAQAEQMKTMVDDLVALVGHSAVKRAEPKTSFTVKGESVPIETQKNPSKKVKGGPLALKSNHVITPDEAISFANEEFHNF